MNEIYPVVIYPDDRSFIDKIYEEFGDLDFFVNAVYKASSASSAFLNLRNLLHGFGPRNRNIKKIKLEENFELTEHQKAEIMFLEFLARKRRREEIVFQYPIPSNEDLKNAKVVVPDISEYPIEWEPTDYTSLDDLVLPRKIFEVKRNGSYQNRPNIDTEINVVLYRKEDELKSDYVKNVIKRYKKKGFDVWGVSVDRYEKVIEKPKFARKYVKKW